MLGIGPVEFLFVAVVSMFLIGLPVAITVALIVIARNSRAPKTALSVALTLGNNSLIPPLLRAEFSLRSKSRPMRTSSRISWN